MPTKNPPPNRPPSHSPARAPAEHHDGDDVLVLERESEKLAPPPMYQVVLLNDDFTPMDFVVDILQEVFGKSQEAAVEIMLRVHHEGRAVCGVYSCDIAMSKAAKVVQAARAEGYPLQAQAEPVA